MGRGGGPERGWLQWRPTLPKSRVGWSALPLFLGWEGQKLGWATRLTLPKSGVGRGNWVPCNKVHSVFELGLEWSVGLAEVFD